eukprot:GHVN01000712.1.p1 GENE.GHVN01000712.1~~GHVN01000712.1.p1  ORF type:complete len:970 (+),score=124.16 GHVN01000712.1:9076-11985(+)
MRPKNSFFVAITLGLLACTASQLSSEVDSLHSENGIFGCEGHVVDVDGNHIQQGSSMLTDVKVSLTTTDGKVLNSQPVSPSGYYFLPVRDWGTRTLVLKATGPKGWKFQPIEYSIEGKCKADHDFRFAGASVSGRILSTGFNEGPAGVNLVLARADGDIIEQTVSEEGGTYRFGGVGRGSYVIKASHPHWKFLIDYLKFDVDVEPINLDEPLVVSAYEVNGIVTSGLGEHLHDVTVVLTTSDSSEASWKSEVAKTNCGFETTISDFNLTRLKETSIGGNVVCATVTAADGSYTFPTVPAGRFVVAVYPYYVAPDNRVVPFVTDPEHVDVDVTHGSVDIDAFKVLSITANGKVAHEDGTGVQGVDISIEGMSITVLSDANGEFEIVSIPLGVEKTLVATKYDLRFPTVHKVKPTVLQQHKLPTIVVEGYSVCGSVPTQTGATLELVMKSRHSKDSWKILSDSKGSYCFNVKNGDYRVTPILTADEQIGQISPPFHDVTVNSGVLRNLDFSFQKFEVTGRIIQQVSDNSWTPKSAGVTVTLIREADQVKSTELVGEDGSFRFEDVRLGSHRVEVGNHRENSRAAVWCWADKTKTIAVGASDLNEIEFFHNGYLLRGHSTAPIDKLEVIPVGNSSDGKSVEVNSVGSGDFSVCVGAPDKFSVIAHSDEYKFESAMFDGALGTLVDIKIVARRLWGSIRLDPTHKGGPSAEILNKLQLDVSLEDLKASPTQQPVLDIAPTLAGVDDAGAIFGFTFYISHQVEAIKPNINVAVRQRNDIGDLVLIFDEVATSYRPSTENEKTWDLKDLAGLERGANFKFTGKLGRYIKGSIEPPVEGVEIKAAKNSSLKEDALIASSGSVSLENLSAVTRTNVNGEFSVGPVETTSNYQIYAEKNGYEFQAQKLRKFRFLSIKQATILVQLRTTEPEEVSGFPDSDSIQSLSPILISLSSPVDPQIRMRKYLSEWQRRFPAFSI